MNEISQDRRDAIADLNVADLSKTDLIELHRRVFGRVGDGPRTPKADYVSRIMAAPADSRVAAILGMIADNQLEVEFDETEEEGEGVEVDPGGVNEQKELPASVAPQSRNKSKPAQGGKPAAGKSGKGGPPREGDDGESADPDGDGEGAGSGSGEGGEGHSLTEERVRVIAREEDEKGPSRALLLMKNDWQARFEALSRQVGSIRAPEPVERIIMVSPTGTRRVIEAQTHAAFEQVVSHATIRDNILLVGPAGCGKSQLAHQVADSLGLSFSFLSCSAGMSESQLLGWLLPIGAGGKFEYVISAFVKAYEEGGVFLLDELDAADENVLLVINAALANGYMAIPTRYKKPIAKRHKDFICIAAANTYGHGADRVYAGRNQLDAATLDRFRCAIVDMTYCPALERKLIDAEVLAWGLPIRAAIGTHRLRRVMSTRALIGFTRQKDALKWTRKEWERSYFADWTKDELMKLGRTAA